MKITGFVPGHWIFCENHWICTWTLDIQRKSLDLYLDTGYSEKINGFVPDTGYLVKITGFVPGHWIFSENHWTAELIM